MTMWPHQYPYKQTPERGVITLLMLLALTLSMSILMATGHRQIIFEQSSARTHAQSAQAFEAAQAGIEWALAHLNESAALNNWCQSSNGSMNNSNSTATLNFKERYLAPELLDNSSTAIRLGPHCTQDQNNQWACQCPKPTLQSDTPVLPNSHVPVYPAARRSFALELKQGVQPGVIDITSTGCVTAQDTPCNLTPAEMLDTQAKTHLSAGRIPALAIEPSAALTARGFVNLGPIAWVIGSSNPMQLAWPIHAGAAIDAPNLKAPYSLGQLPALPSFANDLALKKLSPEALFLELFRMDKTSWKNQPTVKKIACATTCDQRLQASIGSRSQNPMVWLEGGLHLHGPSVIGSAEHPVLLVVDGPVAFDAPVFIYGLIYSTSSQWRTLTSAHIEGAVVVEGNLQAIGSSHIERNIKVLKRLGEQAGTYARISGSWRDF
jgi:hypothetical protein